MTWGLFTDGLLAVLLIVTIAYAAVLNRRMGVLRDARDEMAQLIREFAQATQHADNSLKELKEKAEVSGRELARRVDNFDQRLERAQSLADELKFMLDRGTAVADRLEKGIDASRSFVDGAGTGAVGAAPRPTAKRTEDELAGAEREEANKLLKTLDSIR